MPDFKVKDQSFKLWKNKYKKDGDKKPDYTGNGMFNGSSKDVALWINNDECLNSIAKECETYNEFLYEMQYMIGSMFTPDGADWGEANLKEMQELIEEIK